MRTITVSQFKAHALGVMKGIAETGEEILVTKHGKPLVLVGPYEEPTFKLQEGKLAGTILEENDILRTTQFDSEGDE